MPICPIEEAFVKLGIDPSQVKPKQREIIDGILDGKKVLGILSTGFGKSFCFQAPALATEGTTIVFSPLLSLMHDQVQFLKSKGIAAEQWNSSQTPAQKRQTKDLFESGQLDLLYMAPEALDTAGWKDIQYPFINNIVIDEAHCLSQWGQDFRPSYLRIYKLIQVLGPESLFACSATIDPYDFQYINANIKFDLVVHGEMTRPNLKYTVINKNSDKNDFQLVNDVGRMTKPVLIFCNTVKHVTSLYNALNARYRNQVGYYHGKADNSHRVTIQEQFLNDQLPILVATNAFGMGVNKPNIRTLVHADLPISLTGYVQEAGRAGRDGINSDCVLYYPVASVYKVQQFFIDSKNPPKEDIMAAFLILQKYGDYCMMTQNELAEKAMVSPYRIQAVISILRKYNIIETRTASRQVFYIQKLKQPTNEPFKMVYDLLEQGNMNIALLPDKLKWTLKEVKSFLKDLESNGYIKHQPIKIKSRRATVFHLLKDNLRDVDWAELRIKKAQAESRFKDMIGFTGAKDKQKYIQDYFENIGKVKS